MPQISEKERARKRAYRAAHREEVAAYNRAYHLAHKAAVNARKYVYRRAHLAKIKAQELSYDVTHRAERVAKAHKFLRDTASFTGQRDRRLPPTSGNSQCSKAA